MPKFFIHPDIAKAETISSDFYTSEEVWKEVREKIFSNSFHFVTDIHQLQESASAFPFQVLEDYLDEPLVLTKDKDGVLRCLSNVCTHRGNILVDKPCKLERLQCRYHGRRFQLDGTFSFMPEFHEVENFPSDRDDLTALPLFQWGNWLFTSLSKEANASLFF